MGIGVVQALDQEGRGIIREGGKVIFVEGALPGETVSYASFRKKTNYELAQLVEIHRVSAQRSQPRCPHFGVCGGCALQHLDSTAQIAIKQRTLEDSLWHIGRTRPEQILPPILGPSWGYRHKARLGVCRVSKKGGVLIGFHEKRSSYIADMPSCEVLPPHVSTLLVPLRKLINRLSIAERMPQIELAVGAENTVLVLRILRSLQQEDESAIRHFADEHGVIFYLQPKGPETAYRHYPVEENETGLSYELPEFALRMKFRPTDFTQVNHAVNPVMVRRAMNLLDPQPGEHIADFFCGLGNFTLPIARSGAKVVGIEGNTLLVQRGKEAAEAHGMGKAVGYVAGNLFKCTEERLSRLGRFDKILLDPPREGAIELVKSLPEQGSGPWRVVYISCNPATLARDAAVLVTQKSYKLKAAGVVNMFPHTAHIESIAVFERAA